MLFGIILRLRNREEIKIAGCPSFCRGEVLGGSDALIVLLCHFNTFRVDLIVTRFTKKKKG
jgi:hypothetical protein